MESIQLFLLCAFLAACFVPNVKGKNRDEGDVLQNNGLDPDRSDRDVCATLKHTCFLSFMKTYCPNTCAQEAACCTMLKKICHDRKVMELCPVTCNFNPADASDNKLRDA